MRQILLRAFFAIYWVATIVFLIVEFNWSNVFMQFLIFVPVTILMILNKDAHALLILVLYNVFMIISNLMGVAYQIGDKNTFEALTGIVGIIYYGNLFLCCVNILRNKNMLSIRFLITIAASYFLLLIISYIIDGAKEEIFKDILTIIATLSLNGLIFIYVCLFPKKKIVIFK